MALHEGPARVRRQQRVLQKHRDRRALLHFNRNDARPATRVATIDARELDTVSADDGR